MKQDNKRAGRKGSLPNDQQFVMLVNSFRQEPAYRALSYGARCLYTELRAAWNKFNNGKIMCSGGHAANLIGCAKSSAAKYLGELTRLGFIVETKRGSIGTDGHGQGTLWRLTELGCPGVNNGKPTKDYRNWKPEKNKSPYRNSVQGIPKFGAPTPSGIPKFGAGHTEIRCAKASNEPSGIPKFGDISRYQGGGAREPNHEPVTLVPDLSVLAGLGLCPLLASNRTIPTTTNPQCAREAPTQETK